MKTNRTHIFGLSMLLCGSFASAQVCNVTTSNMFGPFAFVANQLNSTTTASTSAHFSKTPMGTLMAGMSSGNPFAATGTLFFDGAGNITASATPTSVPIQVGTDTLNYDCLATI